MKTEQDSGPTAIRPSTRGIVAWAAAMLAALFAIVPQAAAGADDLPPQIAEAVYSDKNDNGVVEAGESLTLVMSRSVVVTTSTLEPWNFFLPVSGDYLGASGFRVSLNPYNSRHIVLTLGYGAHLTVAGEFSTETLQSGSPSGIDLASGLPPGTIQSLTGQDAVDGGVPGIDDSGADVLFACVTGANTIGAAGGSVAVTDTPEAAYTRHALAVPMGALSQDVSFTLRPPVKNLGAIGAVQIDAFPDATTFSQPARLTLQYRDSDVDREMGRVEASLKIHQLVETAPGAFEWRALPGEHDVDKAEKTASIDLDSLDPAGAGGEGFQIPGAKGPRPDRIGQGGVPSVMAVLPGSTIEPSTIYVKSSLGGSAAIAMGPTATNDTSATLAPGDDSDYLLHRIRIPDYVETTSTDTERIAISISAATLARRASESGRSFPSESSAIFVITTRDAADSALAFTDPVEIRVQYMDGTQNEYDDLWDFDEAEATKDRMRVVYDKIDGAGVDFGFSAAGQSLSLTAGTVEAHNVTNLTGSSGIGVWGAVAVPYDPDASAAKDWTIYE